MEGDGTTTMEGIDQPVLVRTPEPLPLDAAPPPGQARQDWWITQVIARRMGLGWSYDGPGDIWEEARGLWPTIAGAPWALSPRSRNTNTAPCAWRRSDRQPAGPTPGLHA